MSKKRYVPAQVTQALERKRKQTASLAQRQGAALGKSARQQLKPLLDDVDNVEVNTVVADMLDVESDYQTYVSKFTFIPSQPQSMSMWAIPSSSWWGQLSGFESPPSIPTDKLEALKAATPYKPEHKLRIPDMVECIIGWRGWALSKSGLLESLGQNSIWPVKQMMSAECEANGRHAAPNWSCSCGVWAFKDVDKLAAAIGSNYSTVRVIGSVSLWGKVIETENGWRAEYAYAKELWGMNVNREQLEELGLIYDVPVRMA